MLPIIDRHPDSTVVPAVSTAHILRMLSWIMYYLTVMTKLLSVTQTEEAASCDCHKAIALNINAQMHCYAACARTIYIM